MFYDLLLISRLTVNVVLDVLMEVVEDVGMYIKILYQNIYLTESCIYIILFILIEIILYNF